MKKSILPASDETFEFEVKLPDGVLHRFKVDGYSVSEAGLLQFFERRQEWGSLRLLRAFSPAGWLELVNVPTSVITKNPKKQ